MRTCISTTPAGGLLMVLAISSLTTSFLLHSEGSRDPQFYLSQSGQKSQMDPHRGSGRKEVSTQANALTNLLFGA